jgi:hypothetical protein
MLEEYCSTCGNLESNHQANQAETLRYVSLAQEVIASLPDDEYVTVLEQILYDWRSHTLPTCDPLSVS